MPGKTFDRIFGGNAVDIRPQGSAELIFGLKTNRLDNPALTEDQRKTTSFDFEEKIQMNVIGKIGDKLKLTTNFNTESTFDFENQMKLEYTGYEDEIIKKIEVGNVSLPLNGTLITGSQSLFGLKTQLQFGRTTITGILSQQKVLLLKLKLMEELKHQNLMFMLINMKQTNIIFYLIILKIIMMLRFKIYLLLTLQLI